MWTVLFFIFLIYFFSFFKSFLMMMMVLFFMKCFFFLFVNSVDKLVMSLFMLLLGFLNFLSLSKVGWMLFLWIDLVEIDLYKKLFLNFKLLIYLKYFLDFLFRFRFMRMCIFLFV